MMKNEQVSNSRRILIPLILTLVGFTASYQLRPFLSDFEFSYVSFLHIPFFPVLVGFSSVITIKLLEEIIFKQKHF